MRRKIFKSGNSMVVSIPKDALNLLGIRVGDAITVETDYENHRILIKPVLAGTESAEIDEIFVHQVSAFISQYRSALAELAEWQNK